jgi:hypothetical protein
MKPALLQIQSDLTGKLAAELAAWNINVKSLRKLVVAGELDAALLAATPVDGRLGCGVLVEMPTFTVDAPNAPGPQGFIEASCLVLENPMLNLEPTSGTLRTAEEVSLRVLQLLHHYRIAGIGTFFCEGGALRPEAAYEGLIGYRVTCRMLFPMEVLAQTNNPTIGVLLGEVTLTPAAGEESADIWYSVDGETYPGPTQVDVNGTPTSFLYTSPFTSAPGTTVRFAAYLAGATGSDVIELTLP